MIKNLILFLVLIFLGLGVFATWEAFNFFGYRSAQLEQQGQIIVDVPPGKSFISIANELYEKALINNPTYFRIYAKLTTKDRDLKVGEYELKAGMGPGEILSVLSSGQSAPRSITVPEGTNMYEVARILEDAGLGAASEYLALFKNKTLIKQLLGEELYSLEGYLFPETYHFTKYTSRNEVVSTMVKNFLNVYSGIEASGKTNMSRHQVVTMASVIEKETGAPEERPLISSVFHNRLSRPMRLQSDPTILYGILDETGVMKKNITRKDLTTFNRYNTYRVNGLPFGPIANPGREALRAVFYPAQSEYIYFVSRNDGTHVFSQTLEQHNAAVRKFQLDRRAREGKSWRDLNKRAE